MQDPIEDGMLDHNIIGHAVWRIRAFFWVKFGLMLMSLINFFQN